MKFELDDSTLLRVSGVAAVALGASALAVPRDYHNRLYSTVRLRALGGRQPGRGSQLTARRSPRAGARPLAWSLSRSISYLNRLAPLFLPAVLCVLGGAHPPLGRGGCLAGRRAAGDRRPRRPGQPGEVWQWACVSCALTMMHGHVE